MSHLKVNDTLKMKFRSTVNENFIQRYEIFKQFIRDTATVTIVKGTRMSLLFVSIFAQRTVEVIMYESQVHSVQLVHYVISTVIVPPKCTDKHVMKNLVLTT